MKTRVLSVWIVATTILSLAPPALAQTPCTAEPGIGERAIDVLYVPNRQDHTISVIDVTPGSACRYQVIETFDFISPEYGNFNLASPHAVFIHPDGKKAFTVNTAHNAVGVIDTRHNVMTKEIPLGVLGGPVSGAMSPDGSRVYVSNLLLGTVSVVDTISESVIDEIPLIDESFLLFGPFGPIPIPPTQMIPIGLEVNPDGTELWATTLFPGSVVVIDIVNDVNTPIIHIHLPPATDPAFGLGFIPLGAVDVHFDSATGVASVIALGRQNVSFGGLPAVFSMADALFRFASPLDPPIPVFEGDGSAGFSEVVVANTGQTWISHAGQLDLNNLPIPPFSTNVTVADDTGVLATPPSGLAGDLSDAASPIGIGRSQDGQFVYVSNFNSATVAVFDADDTAGPVAMVPVGNGPFTSYQHTIPALPTPPTFVSGPCGQSFDGVLGEIISFTFTAETTTTDDDEDELTLDASGLPDPSVMTPLLPIFNPGDSSNTTTVTSDFSWQPVLASEAQSHVINFEATGAFASTTCQVTINVSLPDPPIFTTPQPGETFQVEIGEQLSFPVSADANPGAGNVVLDLLGGTSLPGTATMTPALPTDGSNPSATSTFDWTPAAGTEGTYGVDYTATDAFGRESALHVNIEVRAPSDDVPFKHFLIFRLKLDKRPHKGTFDFAGAFRLGNDSDGIDPQAEDLTIGFDSFELTIPAGSFSQHGRIFRFHGTVDGVRVSAWLKGWRGIHHRHRWWTFYFKGKDADLSGVTNPVQTKLQIGDDFGDRRKWARIKH